MPPRGSLRRLAGRQPRVPVRRQFTESECGAACLAMVLSAHGRRTSTAECREELRVSRDGADALAVTQAARDYGLQARAYSVEPEHLEGLPLPAVAHMDFRHFVVVERVTARGVIVVDPAVGRQRLDPEEFDRRFTGVLLCFQPTDAFVPRRSRPPSRWRHHLREAVRSRSTVSVFAQMLGASALVAVLGLVGPAVTKVVVDDVLGHGLEDLLTVLAIGIAAIVVTRLAVSLLRGLLVVSLQARVDAGLMLPFFRHVLSLPYSFFGDRSSGDLLMRLMSNANVRDVLSTQTAQVLIDSVLVVTYAAILLSVAPGFGAVVVGLGSVQILVLAASARRMHRLMRRELQAQADSQSYLVEALRGIGPIKASGAEQQAFDRWAGLFSTHLHASVRRGRLSAAVSALLGTVNTMGPIVTLAVGVVYVLDGRLSLGTMLAVNALAAAFLAPLASLTTAGQQVQMLGATVERLGDVARAEPEPRGSRRPEGARRATGVELEGVTFRYGSEAEPVLADVTLSVRPGEKVAVVGETGSGKSTLAKVILGLHRPESGSLSYDGVPADELDLVALRQRFGVVLQEPSLFAGSVRANIAFNRPGMPMEEVVRAARLAAIHDDVERMPMGYETLVSEGGSAMSGGQQQRIALARALATEPALLVLDEATSHLDVVTEHEVDANIGRLDCTRVVIAHRLSTVRDADRIIVMERGRLVEQGTHGELLEAGGAYARLVAQQLSGQEAPSAAPLGDADAAGGQGDAAGWPGEPGADR